MLPHPSYPPSDRHRLRRCRSLACCGRSEIDSSAHPCCHAPMPDCSPSYTWRVSSVLESQNRACEPHGRSADPFPVPYLRGFSRYYTVRSQVAVVVCSLSIRLISARLGCGRHVASHALIVRGRLWMYVQNEKRENDTQRLAVSHARFQNSRVETTLSVAPHTPRKARLKGCRTTAVSLTDFVRSNAQRRNVLPWPLPGVSRLRGPPCALSQAPRATQGCNLYPQFSAQVRERDVPQGGVVLQATLRAPSLPGYGVAHLRRRCLGAGAARVASSSSHRQPNPSSSRVMSPERVTSRAATAAPLHRAATGVPCSRRASP